MSGPVTPREPTRLREAWPAVAALAAVFLIEMVDNSVLSVALPTIARDLHADPVGLQWITGAYSLVFGSTMLLFGGIADRFGRRRTLVLGLLVFAAASGCVVLVASTAGLIAVRAACGLSAAMTAPGTMALGFRLFPDDALRARASGVISGVGMTGLAAGPLVGGAVLTVAPWQALILVNVPIALAAAWAIRRGIRPDRPDELRRTPIDLAGGLLGGLALAAGLVAPTLGLEDGWSGWRPLGAGIAAVALGCAFVARERRTPHPLLRPSLLRPRPVWGGLANQAAMALALAAVGYTVQLQLQYAWGWAPAPAAAGSLPQTVAMIAGGFVVEPLLRRAGLSRAGVLGSGLVVASVALYAVLSRGGYAWVAGSMVLLAVGMRLVMVTTTIGVMKGLPRDHLSIASALNDTAQEVGSAVGVAATGTILAAALPSDLAAAWGPATTAAFDDAVRAAGLALAAVTLVVTAATHLPVRRGRP